MRPDDADLLRKIAAGRTQAEIARELGVQRTTVTARVRRMVAQYQCNSTYHLLALYGRTQGLREAEKRIRGNLIPEPLDEVEVHLNKVMESDVAWLKNRADGLLL